MQNRFSRSNTRRMDLMRNEVCISRIAKSIFVYLLISSWFQPESSASSSVQLVNVEPVINQVLRTVESMRVDLQQINNRINIVERSLTEVKNHQLRKKVVVKINVNVLNYSSKYRSHKSKISELKYPKWWPFSEISPNWFILLIVWPFVARRLVNMMERRRR